MCKFYMSLTLCLVHIMEKNILVKKFPHYVRDWNSSFLNSQKYQNNILANCNGLLRIRNIHFMCMSKILTDNDIKNRKSLIL